MSTKHYVITIKNTAASGLTNDTRFLRNVRGTRGDYTTKIGEAFVFDSLSSMETAKSFVERDVEFGSSPFVNPGEIEIIAMELAFTLTPIKEEDDGYDSSAVRGDPVPKHIFMDKNDL